MNIPRLIASKLEAGLRRRLALTEDQCYVCAASSYVNGQPDRVVQIVIGSAKPEGSGMGAQEGGCFQRRANYTFAIWLESHMDPNGWTREALLEVADGMLDFSESVFDLLKHTYLGNPDGNLLVEPLRYEGESATQWYDPDQGTFLKTITYSGTWFEDQGDITLSDADFE